MPLYLKMSENINETTRHVKFQKLHYISKYNEVLNVSLFHLYISVRMLENMDQKISEYGHLSRSVTFMFTFMLLVLLLSYLFGRTVLCSLLLLSLFLLLSLVKFLSLLILWESLSQIFEL